MHIRIGSHVARLRGPGIKSLDIDDWDLAFSFGIALVLSKTEAKLVNHVDDLEGVVHVEGKLV